jgi:uncharacterized protein with von Willebrand factor type A (vWA) domain
MLNGKADGGPVSNLGKHLMIFNDRSGSMSGSPFTALKSACESIADDIFDDSKFESVHTVFYDDAVKPLVTSDKGEYLDNIMKAKIGGCTSFVSCFEYIL